MHTPKSTILEFGLSLICFLAVRCAFSTVRPMIGMHENKDTISDLLVVLLLPNLHKQTSKNASISSIFSLLLDYTNRPLNTAPPLSIHENARKGHEFDGGCQS